MTRTLTKPDEHTPSHDTGWAKKQELFLGGTTQSLLHLGKLLADTPV